MEGMAIEAIANRPELRALREEILRVAAARVPGIVSM
jgi:hypothetical protein